MTFISLITAWLVYAQLGTSALPGLPQTPDGLPAHVLERVMPQFTPLLRQGEELTQEVREFHAQCDRIRESDVVTGDRCRQRSTALSAVWAEYNKRLLSYNNALASWRKKFPLASYQPSGR